MSAHSSSFRERLNISRLALQFPWLTWGFWIAVSVAGLFAFSSLKYALFPDVTFPVVVVSATAPIATPIPTAQETETKLTRALEQGLQSLKKQGLDGTQSSTYPGRSIVSLSFAVGTNLEKSTQAVEARLKQLTLPAGSTYDVSPINLNESAVVSYAIEGSGQTLAQLTRVAQVQIMPAIAQVPGVLKVTLTGVPGDTSLANLPKSGQAEQVVLPPGMSSVRLDGVDALAVEVVKRGNANTLDVVREVQRAIAKLQPTLSNVTIQQAETQADYINEATQATVDALGLAIALSVLVIFPFLWNWKATLISALAIPTSLLGTAIVMAVLGLNLETITLLALALVIGIIVDDAIVDVENIARHLEEGVSPRQAAIEATDEIGLTVTAATLTIVAVFLPVALMGGVIGQFFKPFGITISAAVLISLLVARTLSPLLAAQWLKPHPHPKQEAQTRAIQVYQPLLGWSLHHRWLVVGIAVLSFVLGIGLIPLIPKGFIPKLDRGEFNITYTAPLPQLLSSDIGTAATSDAATMGTDQTNPLLASLDAAKQLETVVLRFPQVQSVFTRVGTREGRPNVGVLYVKLHKDRTAHTSEVQDQIRQKLPVIAGVTTSVEDIQFVDTGGEKPLQVALYGDDLKDLAQTAAIVKNRVEKLPGFSDVSTSTNTDQSHGILEIKHNDGRRVAYISANLQQGVALGDATDQVVAIANQVKPANITLDLGGDSARIGEIFSSFAPILGLSVLCILVVLLLLFRSWTDPLVIAFSLPLSLVGALLASLLTGSEFGMISMIGMIFLLGLTNKNAILLVDYMNQLRRTGLSRTEAILTAGSVRLRPILMTTAATILGMLPIALGLGAGSELRAPMAIAIIGGLVTSTLLSLLVVPVVYALFDDLQSNLRQKRKHPLTEKPE
jgi:multidrug efflux pump subunit AcrB